jgi:hypothetical protein|tara:strand:+ start:5961 stop:7004 length:1044 start_codon:yes stop_codon:yes gene_type:complete
MAERYDPYNTLAATLPKESFLRPEFQARDLDELLDSLLIFDDILPKQTVDATTFSYQIETDGAGTGTRGSASSDVKKEYAPLRADGSEFSYVSVSPLEMAVGVLQARGVAFKLTEAARQDHERLMIDPLARTRKRVAYWLAEQINAEMVTTLTNDFSVTNTDDTGMEDIMSQSSDFGTENTVGHLAGTLDSTYYWDEADANPVRTILDLQTVFEDQDGYNYSLTDVYMRYRDLHLLSTFITEVGADWAMDPLGGFTASNIAGITFHGLKNVAGFPTTVGDGYIMGLDRNNPVGQTYQSFSKEFPQVNNMSFHSYMDDATHDFHYQMFYTRGTVVVEPKAMAVLKVRD